MSRDDRELQVHDYLRARFDTVGARLRFQGGTKEEVAAWRRRLRRKLTDLLGLRTMSRCDPRPRVTERHDCGDHVRERVEIRVEPGLVMPMFVLIPKTGTPPFPVMLTPHGHGAGGKAAVAGVLEDEVVAEKAKSYRYGYGIEFCRAGFITFCPESRGFGERQETLARRQGSLGESCLWINHMALPLGQTVTGMWVWDLQQLVDYAGIRPDCDVRRLGCAGLSGGGLQALWLAALDNRVKAAVVSGYFYGVKESLLDLHANCSCNYVPHLWEVADHGDLAALIAPRPLMIQTGSEDRKNGAGGLANVRGQVRITRRVYRVLGAQRNLVHDVFPGGHRWDSTNTIPFMKTHLA